MRTIDKRISLRRSAGKHGGQQLELMCGARRGRRLRSSVRGSHPPPARVAWIAGALMRTGEYILVSVLAWIHVADMHMPKQERQGAE